MSKATDVFLSHNWGTDEAGRDNHERVGVINKALQGLGYKTWYDADAMHGSVPHRMAEGIDNTNLVVVFVTAKYREKVNTGKASDNCRLEFQHALNVKTGDKVVCVLMDKSMGDTSKWGGILGLYCGSNLYVNMSGDVNDEDYLNEQLELLIGEMEGLGAPRPQGAPAPAPKPVPAVAPAAPAPTSTGKKLSEILQGATEMSLQGCHKKYYLSAQPKGTAECNRTNLGAWETIKVEKSADGDQFVSLKSCHGKYLSAQPNGQLQWNRDGKAGWERFEVHHISRNKIALKSFHGKWMSAQPDGRIEVDRDNLGPWEQFIVQPAIYSFPSTTVALQGKHNNWLVSAQPDGKVECNRQDLNLWEQIRIEKEGDRHIYLKSCHGKYLSAQPNGQLEWNRPAKNGWERFEVVHIGDDRIGLKSFHGRWMSAQPDGRIEVNRDNLGPWEDFNVKKVN